jgi:hypothetical protein
MGLGVCYLFVLLSSTSAMPSQETHPQAPDKRWVEFTKTTSNETPAVGEVFSFTLDFSTWATETLAIQIRMVDPNPAPSYLEILSDTIEGGAVYSPTIGDGDGVVWEDVLGPGADPQKVTYQMRVTGIPPEALPDGYPVDAWAWIEALDNPLSEPVRADIIIRLMPAKIFAPIITRNYGG